MDPHRSTGLILFFVILSLSFGLSAGTTDWDEAKLRQGEFLFRVEDMGKEKLPRFHAAAVVDCSVDEVWKVINDYEHFKDFMPGVVESRIEKREGNTIYFYERDHVPVLKDTWYLLRCEHNDEKHRKTMTLVEGSVDSLDATWSVKPFDNGKALVEYAVQTDPGLYLPRWVQKRIVSKTVRGLFQGIRNVSCSSPSGP